MAFKIWFDRVKLAILIIVPIVLLLLPATFFDTGKSICLSRVLLDMECYGCGMTRAIMHLIHGNITVAAQYNKLAFIVLPILIMLWSKELLACMGYKILKWL